MFLKGEAPVVQGPAPERACCARLSAALPSVGASCLATRGFRFVACEGGGCCEEERLAAWPPLLLPPLAPLLSASPSLLETSPVCLETRGDLGKGQRCHVPSLEIP